MAESDFVKRLKENLNNEISNLILNVWGLAEFEIEYESKKNISRLKGRPDLILVDKDFDTRPVGIEIEHISGYEQSVKNIKKFRDWTHNSQYRSCGLLHIFNRDCNLSEDQLAKLMEYGKINMQKQLGFYYDSFFYQIDDNRMTKQLAIEITSSKEFRVRLWDLLRCVGLVKN